MLTRLKYLLWHYRMGHLWWQRRSPSAEWDTRIYEGLPGSGKTLLAVRDALDLMRQGVRVVSNVYIRDPLTGDTANKMGGWLDMLRWSVQTLIDGIPTVFVIDEIHLACDSRAWNKTPVWWLNLMAQRRHFGIGIIGTTQDITSVEKRLRALIGRVIEVRPSTWRRYFPSLPLFCIREVDMTLIDTDAEAATGREFTTWVNAEAFAAYSTRELMPSLDFAELTEEEAVKEIRALTERAVEHASTAHLPAFSDPVLEAYPGLDLGSNDADPVDDLQHPDGWDTAEWPPVNTVDVDHD